MIIAILVLASILHQLDTGAARRASALTELVFPSDDSQEVYALMRRLSPTEQSGSVHFPAKEVRTNVYQRILAMASKSQKSRKTVIRALVSTLEDVNRPSDSRIYAADLLGKLRAVEGLDAMVANLDLKGSFSSLSLNSRPMVAAVVQVGEGAISRLERALYMNGQAIRAEASVALGFIGGKRAKRALERALPSQTDEEVITHLKGALSEIAMRSNRNLKRATKSVKRAPTKRVKRAQAIVDTGKQRRKGSRISVGPPEGGCESQKLV